MAGLPGKGMVPVDAATHPTAAVPFAGGAATGVCSDRAAPAHQLLDLPTDAANDHARCPVAQSSCDTPLDDGITRKKNRKQRARPPSVERPCDHNQWADLRTRRRTKILQCRTCGLKWKVNEPLVKCTNFMYSRCRQGSECRMLHIYKAARRLKQKARRERELTEESKSNGSEGIALQQYLLDTLQGVEQHDDNLRGSMLAAPTMFSGLIQGIQALQANGADGERDDIHSDDGSPPELGAGSDSDILDILNSPQQPADCVPTPALPTPSLVESRTPTPLHPGAPQTRPRLARQRPQT